MAVVRRKFQGVLNILSFNRHFYVIGVSVLIVALLVHSLVDAPEFIWWMILLGFLYGLIIPLVVSAYVYDFSKFYEFNWLNNYNIENKNTTQLVNINAGFDETSFSIKNKYPKAALYVYDFYDESRHTEPAIVRARKVSTTFPNTTQITTNHIPLANQSVDVIFLLSAAHEIRSIDEKVEFLSECRRVCKVDGTVLMVEHLRDFPNFAAFTVGFTHFFSRKHWKRAFTTAGFSDIRENKFTPFMSIFNCSP